MNTSEKLSRRHFVQFGAAALLASPLLKFAPAAFASSPRPSSRKKSYPLAKKFVKLPDGTRAPALGIGTGAAYRTPHEEVEEALRIGISLGMRLIDTAENYGKGGDVERVVGRAIAGQREQVFLVTKLDISNATSEQAIRHSCERSLRNLGADYIDLYLLHWPVADLRPVVGTFEALKAEGVIRNWGVSNFYMGDMERLYAIPGGKNCAVNQVGYSLADRKIESQGLVDWSARHDVTLMAHSPLGRVGKLMQSPIMVEVAAKHGVSTSAIATAWTMRSGSVISIPGSPRVKYAHENARAAEVTLDADDLARLDRAFPAPSSAS